MKNIFKNIFNFKPKEEIKERRLSSIELKNKDRLSDYTNLYKFDFMYNNVIIYKKIIPNVIINEGKIFDLPSKYSTPINSIKIVTNMVSEVNSVYLDAYHPNSYDYTVLAEDIYTHSFCINHNLIYEEISINFIKVLLKNIEVYNIDNPIHLNNKLKEYCNKKK